MTSQIAVYDTKTKDRMYVCNDRPQGGSSLSNGTIELMIHRRVLKDDERGLRDNLNEILKNGLGEWVLTRHIVEGGSDTNMDRI